MNAHAHIDPRVDLAAHIERSRSVRDAHEQVVGEREPKKERLELMVPRRFTRKAVTANFA